MYSLYEFLKFVVVHPMCLAFEVFESPLAWEQGRNMVSPLSLPLTLRLKILSSGYVMRRLNGKQFTHVPVGFSSLCLHMHWLLIFFLILLNFSHFPWIFGIFEQNSFHFLVHLSAKGDGEWRQNAPVDS